MTETGFTAFWITAFICLTASYALFFWFALKCGMLKDRERARHLPLWAEVPDKDEFRVPSSEFRVEEQKNGKEK